MRWRRLGPGGGGAMYIPTVHRTDANTAFVACDMTGSYLTRDAGESWRQINFHGRVQGMAWDAWDAQTLYAGASGLYMSADMGGSFRLLYPPQGQVTGETTLGDHASHAYVTRDALPEGNVEAILSDPSTRGTLWMGLSTAKLRNFYVEGTLSLLCSTDGGETWPHALALSGSHFVKICPMEAGKVLVLTDSTIYTVCVDEQGIRAATSSDAPGEIADAAYGRDPQSGQWVYFYTLAKADTADGFSAGVYRSRDAALSWEAIGGGLAEHIVPGSVVRFSHIAVCEADAREVYLSLTEPLTKEERVEGAEAHFGVLRSRNMGDDFAWALRIGDENPENRTLGWVEKDYATGWGGAPFGLGVCPSDPEVCYATDWGTAYRTADGSRTWQQLYTTAHEDGTYTSRGLDVTLVYQVHFDPHDERHVAIACTDIGLFDSWDAGESWHHRMQGVPEVWSNSCYCMAFDPEIPGRAWSGWTNCHDLPRPKMYMNGGFSRRLGGVLRSEDGLCSWQVSSGGLPEHIAPTCMVLDPNSLVGSRTLYITAMGDGVYKSSDDGATWAPVNSGLGGNRNAWKIFLLPDGALYLLVARGLEDGQEVDGGLYCSRDGAETWQALPMPGQANAPNFLAWDPDMPSRLYLACWPRYAQGRETDGGLYRSEDAGHSWRNIYDERSHVYGVAVDPSRPAHVYATNFENMLLHSEDYGEHFTRVQGYDFKWAHQPVFDPYRRERLYVATFGSGLWMGTEEDA